MMTQSNDIDLNPCKHVKLFKFLLISNMFFVLVQTENEINKLWHWLDSVTILHKKIWVINDSLIKSWLINFGKLHKSNTYGIFDCIIEIVTYWRSYSRVVYLRIWLYDLYIHFSYLYCNISKLFRTLYFRWPKFQKMWKIFWKSTWFIFMI